MAKFALFDHPPTMTADDAAETHGGRAGAEKPPSSTYLYILENAEPIVCWIAGNPYTATALVRRRERMEAELTVVTVQAPAREAA